MAKKDFTGGLGSLLGDNKKEEPKRKKRGRPRTQTKKVLNASQEGTKENETRATFILNETLLDKIKAIAWWDRKSYKDVIKEALEDYIDKKKPKARPEEVREADQARNQRLMRTGTARKPKF